ncbi:MAG: hypothetical protein JST04_18210 [Bdellovibrionales bacterium]|nr:hypothetical protein [Bdellovibrionales bacterium]
MRVPKALESIFAFYPAAQGILVATDVVRLVRSPDAVNGARLVFSAYLLSPLVWTALKALFGPTPEGVFRIGKRAKGGNLWFLYYNLQSFYTSFPTFERALRLVPGLYSAWLRLWGSRIGKKVNWTAECQIVDRGHLEVGDRAFFGNRSYLSAHALKKTDDRYLLFVKKITVGADAMVSYSAHVGPGVRIGARAHIEAGAGLYPNMKVGDGESYALRERNHGNA